jgi:hypothetical protein
MVGSLSRRPDSIDAIALRLGVRRDYLALLVRLSYWTAYMSPLWTRKPPSLTADAISEKRQELPFHRSPSMTGMGRERNGSLRTIRSGSGRSMVLVGGHNSTQCGNSARSSRSRELTESGHIQPINLSSQWSPVLHRDHFQRVVLWDVPLTNHFEAELEV